MTKVSETGAIREGLFVPLREPESIGLLFLISLLDRVCLLCAQQLLGNDIFLHLGGVRR